MKRKRYFGLLFALFGILLAIAPKWITPTCPPMENGGFMKCHWMGQAVFGIGIVLALFGLLIAVLKNRAVAYGVSLAGVILSLLPIWVALDLIGGCMNHHMQCHKHSMPVIYLISGIMTLSGIIYLYLERKHEG